MSFSAVSPTLLLPSPRHEAPVPRDSKTRGVTTQCEETDFGLCCRSGPKMLYGNGAYFLNAMGKPCRRVVQEAQSDGRVIPTGMRPADASLHLMESLYSMYSVAKDSSDRVLLSVFHNSVFLAWESATSGGDLVLRPMMLPLDAKEALRVAAQTAKFQWIRKIVRTPGSEHFGQFTLSPSSLPSHFLVCDTSLDGRMVLRENPNDRENLVRYFTFEKV